MSHELLAGFAFIDEVGDIRACLRKADAVFGCDSVSHVDYVHISDVVEQISNATYVGTRVVVAEILWCLP